MPHLQVLIVSASHEITAQLRIKSLSPPFIQISFSSPRFHEQDGMGDWSHLIPNCPNGIDPQRKAGCPDSTKGIGVFVYFIIPVTGNFASLLTVFLGIDPALSVPLGIFLWLAVVVVISVSAVIRK